MKTDQAVFVIDSRRLYRQYEKGNRELICSDEALAGEKFYYGSSHGRLIGKFYRAIEENTDDYVHVRDAQLSNRVIDAVFLSGKTGETVSLQA